MSKKKAMFFKGTQAVPPATADINNPDFSWDVDNLNLVNGDWIPDVKLPSGNAVPTGKSSSIIRTYVDVNGILQTNTIPSYRIDYSRGVSDPFLLLESVNANFVYPSEPTSTPTIGSDLNVTYESYAWANGLTDAVRVLDNTVERSIYYNFDTIPWSANADAHSFVIFVEMDDGSQPIIGTDFDIIMGGDNVIGGTVYEQQYGSTIWKVMAWTNNKVVGTPNDFGVQKLVSHSSKAFRMTGFLLGASTDTSVTKWCNTYIKTTTTSLTTLADDLEYDFGAGYTEGTLFIHMDLTANSGGNLNLRNAAGVNSFYFGVYWNTIRTVFIDPNGLANNFQQLSAQKLTKFILTWDATGAYWYSEGVQKRYNDHTGLTPYEDLDYLKVYLTKGSSYGSDRLLFKKIQYWEKKISDADAITLSTL
jgi:hypothetical protein